MIVACHCGWRGEDNQLVWGEATVRDRCPSCGAAFRAAPPLRLLPGKTPAIASELYTALERLGADPELLSIVGSMGDTATDTEVLRLLQDYNATGKVLHGSQ